ncbi:hypothetical protein BHYA_0031g00510 [Botrytis hyacinthi]|uniref:Uncharacterized protein n=1 Tax=Botrytis hyacinthi TaxID=278943 RepID=A0A4Z1GYE6_9HELO|nr:hypothetical protein BHYA_0031g00510 [Botrytis hyacinthi]
MVAVHEKLFSIKFSAFPPGWNEEKPWAKFILRCILNHKEANTEVGTDEPSSGYPNNDTNFKNEERFSVVDLSEQESSNDIELLFENAATLAIVSVTAVIFRESFCLSIIISEEKDNRRRRKRANNVWDFHAVFAGTAMQDFADDFSVFLELVIMAYDINIGVFSPVIFKDPELDLDMA